MTDLSRFGMAACNTCGHLMTDHAPCRSCATPKIPPAVQCLGLDCPKKEACALYKPSTPGTHNLTKWIDPAFDPASGMCENETPIVLPLLNNPME